MRTFFRGKRAHEAGAEEKLPAVIWHEERESEPNKKRILILTLSNLALQVLWFFYRMMLSRLAGTEVLGLQSLVMQVYSIMVSVCISGLNVAVMTVGARIWSNGGQSGGIRRLFKNALVLFLLLFTAMAAPLFIWRKRIASGLIGDPGAALAVAIVLGCIFLTGIENILKSVHLATGRVGKTACSELMEQSIRFLLVFLLLRKTSVDTDHGQVALILFGMLLSEFFSVSFLFHSYKKHYRFRGNPDAVNEASLSRLAGILAPAALTSVVSTVFASAAALLLPGRLMLAGYTRQAALASIGTLNAVAVPLVTFPTAFIGAVATVLLPSVSTAALNNDFKRIKRILSRSFTAAALALLTANMLLMHFSAPISGALFGVVPSRLCFLLLTAKAGIIYFQMLTTAALNGLMKQRIVLAFALIGELLQLVLIYLLSALSAVHIYGYLAAMCIGEGARLAVSLLYLKHFFRNSGV